jgi:hypothetical protein
MAAEILPPIRERVRAILESARVGVARSVNTNQVVAQWLIGREIVEEEQSGRNKAGYGEARQFYLIYPRLLEGLSVRHPLRDEFPETEAQELRVGEDPPEETPSHLNPDLSWPHYRALLRVERSDARTFYEIEAVKNNWSARELERQINSLLFERLAKSKDKAGLRKLATRGREIAQPADIFKDPMVIEFLGLPESPRRGRSGRSARLSRRRARA